MERTEIKIMEENINLEQLPTAVHKSKKRFNWFWLIPISTCLITILILYQILVQSGVNIQISIKQGHGIKVGSPLRCKGIDIGEVTSISLSEDFNRVIINALINKASMNAANTGSRFWIEYPRINITGIGGLDTIVGPRYIRVIPGRGKIHKKFIALNEAPVDQLSSNKHLEIMINANKRDGINIGSPVFYRQMLIGKVISVNLENDSTSVLFRISINPAYALLIRENTLFYIKSGASFKMGIRGIQFNADSLQTILRGGIHLAVPNIPGDTVASGTHFKLTEEVNEVWKLWKPNIPIGSQLLPPNSPLPNMKKLFCKTKGMHFWNSDINKKTWAIVENKNIYFFKSFLDGNDQSLSFEFEGQTIEFKQSDLIKSFSHSSDTLVSLALPSNVVIKIKKPLLRILQKRIMQKPENTIIITANTQNGIALSKKQLQKIKDGRWRINPSVPLNLDQKGAAILSRKDGALVGLLQIDSEKTAYIFPITK